MLPGQLFRTLPPLLPEQDELQPAVPAVLGSTDCRTRRQRLERIDEILRTSRVEEVFVRLCLKRRPVVWKHRTEWENRPERRMCEGDQLLFQRISSVAPRATVAHTPAGVGLRAFSARLAGASLIVGMYFNPPERAIVLCGEKKGPSAGIGPNAAHFAAAVGIAGTTCM
jgi:hypothetical protein